MNNYSVQNPIAFIIFNRPDNTKIVFNQIKSVKPSKLFIIADGPRENLFEKEKCIESLEILKQIDWMVLKYHLTDIFKKLQIK